ncbi:hypothetical protein [Natronospira sp.]|uniref:DoxX family protein n=1 Tax=Natronospira sp. TaxID=2024970 RepID=UPI00387361F7
MTTPIIMLVLIITPWLIARGISGAMRSDFDARSAAAIGLSILFMFTGIGHFAQTELMVQMIPTWVPVRVFLVYVTGILEFVIAVGFLIPKCRRFTGWAAAAILILFFPANVHAAINHVPMGGHAWGPVYLLVRAPLQAVILFWVYWFTIRQPGTALQADAPPAVRQ